MGKKKDKFISNKAVVIKLASRDISDPNRNEQNKNLPVYEIVSYPNDERLDEKALEKRNRILDMFDDQDQGLYDQQDSKENQLPTQQELVDQVEGKSGLWIHTLQKLKSQNIKNELMQTGEFEDVQIQEQEEYEDGDEDYDYDEEDSEEEKQGEKKERKYIKLGDFQKQQEEEEEEDSEEEEEKEMTQEEKADKLFNIDDKIDYTKVQIKAGVKTKKFNEYGLPITGYDYSQHIIDSNRPAQGKLVAEFSMDPQGGKFNDDKDYEEHEMTEEQKEVFEAMQEAEIYEDLEDDFVMMVQDGQQAIEIKEEPKKTKKKSKKVIHFQPQPMDKYQMIDEKFIEKQMKKKNSDDDMMGDEEFDEEEFKKAMDLYDECEQEEKMENKISQNELNDILDDHIQDINKRNQLNNPQLDSDKNIDDELNRHKDLPAILQSLQERIKEREMEELEKRRQNGEEGEEKKNKALYPYNIKQRMREEREIKVIDRDAAKNKFRQIYGDQVKDKDHVAPLSLEEDVALQNYMNRDAETEEKEQEILDKKFEEKFMSERKLDETIATKSFSKSTVHEHLNVIEEMDKKKKKSKKLKEHERREQREATAILEDQEQEDLGADEDEKIRDVSAIFQKRTKEESEEERKLRKKLVKEFNKQRKENKRLFKKGFDDMSNAKKNKLQQQTTSQQNMRGVQVVKL